MSEIRTVLVLSTAHVSKETRAILNQPNSKWPCAGGPYDDAGWFLYCNDENNGVGVNRIPDDLFAVMIYARDECGAEHILLDRDAPIEPALPTFEW